MEAVKPRSSRGSLMLRSVLYILSLLMPCVCRQQRSLLYKATKKVLFNVVMSVKTTGPWTEVRSDNVKSLCVILESTEDINSYPTNVDNMASK
jgi:hypothetical protein